MDILITSTIREIKNSLGRYLAILTIIALGVGLFSCNGANGSGFVHAVANINGPLFGHILGLHSLWELVGDD